MRIDRGILFDNLAVLRLLIRHLLLEFYLYDIMIGCFSLLANATAGVDWFKTATSKFEDVDKY